MKVTVIFCLISLISLGANAQLTIQNTLETQYGKLPDESASAFPSIYDRLIGKYRHKAWSAQVTVEQYHTKYTDRNYLALSQGLVRYKKKKWKVDLGNFYETLGRGLLLRSYEIRGSILEDVSFRSRNYFHRDILGANVTYKTKRWSLQAIHGYSLNNVLPPTFDRPERRSDRISSLAGEVRLPKRQKVGLIVMNHKQPTTTNQQYATLYASGPLWRDIDYSLEIARSLNRSNAYSIYSSVSGSAGALSYSLEYKRYRNFVIGSGINEPPALIKQHTYRLLNRSTHVTNPDSEEGYQLDIYYLLPDGSTLTFNHALAYNDFGTTTALFREYFVEWSGDFSERVASKVFLDFAQDPFKGEKNRFAMGWYADVSLGDCTLHSEVEVQFFDRNEASIDNQSYVLGVRYRQDIFVALQMESTSDPFLVKTNSTRRQYIGGIIDYRINRKHSLRLFGGERRGGPLCSAGVCYEILDFRGLEARWTSRW